MTAVRTKWTNLRVGDLFQTRDDVYPVRVVNVLPDSVMVRSGFKVWRIFFRAGATVLRFN